MRILPAGGLMGTDDVLGLLRRHWLFVLVLALVGAAAGLAWAATRTPEYTAQAEVIIAVTGGQTTGELAQGSNFSQQQARNFAALATREIVLAPVIDGLELDTSVASLRRSVSATVPLNTSLISLEAVHSSPQTAADISNAVAQELAHTVAELSPRVDDFQGAPVRAQIVETAAVPVVPSSPNVTLYAVFGLLAGLILGVTIQVVSEVAVSRIRTTGQLESATSAPVLGAINRDRETAQHPVAVVAAPLSVRAEQVRHLRTALKFISSRKNRAFVVSSALSGEGKSTTAANIAAAFAADGASTCLIEADLRRPSLADVMDLSSGIGLSDVIAGEYTIDEALQTWGPHDLHVITAGSPPPNPSELLGSEASLEVLRQLHDRFAVIIIDTPPLNAVTDPMVLGRQFGGVVLVVGANRARVSDLRRTMMTLAAAEVPLNGTVLNLVKDEEAGTYAYASADGSVSGSPAKARRRSARKHGGRGTRPLKSAGKAAVAVALAVLVVLGWAALNQRVTQEHEVGMQVPPAHLRTLESVRDEY